MTKPNSTIYNSDDLENYAEILNTTGAMKNPNNLNKPKSFRSEKYLNIFKPIWENRPYRGEFTQLTPKRGSQGSGVNKTIILPSDPDALIERLNLLYSGILAGNTGAISEAVAIYDELLRLGLLNKDKYKSLMTQLKPF